MVVRTKHLLFFVALIVVPISLAFGHQDGHLGVCAGHAHHHPAEALAFPALNRFLGSDDRHFAAVENDIMMARCRGELPSFAQMLRYLHSGNDSEVEFENEEFAGLNLRGADPELMGAFKDLLWPKELNSGRRRSVEEVANFQFVEENCGRPTTVLCAAQEIFGVQEGVQLLYLRMRFGMNASHIANQDAIPATSEEMNSFIRTLHDFPDWIFPIQQNYRMVMYPHTQVREGMPLGVYANASMEYYDRWRSLGTADRDIIVAHEIAHVFAHTYQLDHGPEWLEIGGWSRVRDKNGEEQWHSSLEHFPSAYSQTNPVEAFAESVLAYRYRPRWFRSLFPEKYEYIKNHVFAGLEYRRGRQCREGPPLWQEHVDGVLSQEQMEQDLYLYLQRACGLESEDFRSCLAAAHADYYVSNEWHHGRLNFTELRTRTHHFSSLVDDPLTGREYTDHVFRLYDEAHQRWGRQEEEAP